MKQKFLDLFLINIDWQLFANQDFQNMYCVIKTKLVL